MSAFPTPGLEKRCNERIFQAWESRDQRKGDLSPPSIRKMGREQGKRKAIMLKEGKERVQPQKRKINTKKENEKKKGAGWKVMEEAEKKKQGEKDPKKPQKSNRK